MSLPVSLTKQQDIQSMVITPTPALYLLSSILIKESFEVRIIDPYQISKDMRTNTIEEIIQLYLSNTDIVCLSANTINWPSTAEFIRYIRQKLNDKIKIIIGGVHPTYFYKHIMLNHSLKNGSLLKLLK